jgi:hypothetical protein
MTCSFEPYTLGIGKVNGADLASEEWLAEEVANEVE